MKNEITEQLKIIGLFIGLIILVKYGVMYFTKDVALSNIFIVPFVIIILSMCIPKLIYTMMIKLPKLKKR